MEEDKIKEILDEKQESQQQVHQQKRTFWNNKKTVKGKALSAWLIVMIVIFMLFTFGLGIYFGKEVFSEKENKNKSNNEKSNTEPQPQVNEIVKEKDFDKDAVILMRTFSYYVHDIQNEELFSKDLVTFNDLSSKYKNRLAFAYFVSNFYSTHGSDENYFEGKDVNSTYVGNNEEQYYLSSATLEKYFKELFGETAEYVEESFESYHISSLSMFFEKNKKVYYSALEGGDYVYERYLKDFYKTVETEDKLEIYGYVVVRKMNSNNNTFGFYKTLNDAMSNTNAIKTFEVNDSNMSTKFDKTKKINDITFDDLSDYKNDASQYKLTFDKENNHYVFKSIEKIK